MTMKLIVLATILLPIVSAKYIPTQDVNQFKKDFLELLGVPEGFTNHTKTELKFSLKYMLGIYNILHQNHLVKSNRYKREGDEILFDLNENELAKADLSDVTVAMNSINKKANHQKLMFSMRGVSEVAGLYGAILKLYKNRAPSIKQSGSILYMINIYKQTQRSDEKTTMKKVAQKLTTSDYTGWLSIDITYVFNTWLESNSLVNELFLTVEPYGGDDTTPLYPGALGIFMQNKNNEKQPFVLAFLSAKDKSIRASRAINYIPRSYLGSYLEHKTVCSIQQVEILIESLGWSEWILAPTSYTTAYCLGTCKYPMKNVTATNHAILQSLMNLKHPDQVQPPKCAPNGYQPMTFLFTEQDNAFMKKFSNMLISSCACQ